MLDTYPRHLVTTIAAGLVVLAIDSAVMSVLFLAVLGGYHLAQAAMDRAPAGPPK